MDYLTQEGLVQIKRELEELRTVKRNEVADRLKEAASFGDLSENAEYVEAKEAEAFLETRIEELEEILRNYQLVKKPSPNTNMDTAEIGRAVHVVAGSDKYIFTLVGQEEAIPQKGRVSSSSPVGRALLGKKVGEEFLVPTPGGKKKFRITKIA